MANEKRLIDLDLAIERAKESDKIVKSSIWETDEVVEFLEDCPIENAVEVVHGRWVAARDGWGLCSNCHRVDEIHEKATHCRFCGAKMDGEKKEN